MNIDKIWEPLSLQTAVLYQDEFINIELDAQARYISVEWLQHPTSEVFRERFHKAAELSNKHKCLYWLSDSRAIHYLEFADQNWMMAHIFPLLPDSHLVKFARITSIESIALMDTARIYSSLEHMQGTELKTQLEIFTDKESALEWLFRDE